MKRRQFITLAGAAAMGTPARGVVFRNLLGLGLATQGGGLGRAVFVLFRFFDRLGGRDDPRQATPLIYRAQDEGSIPSDQRQQRAHKISGIDGDRFLALTGMKGFDDLFEARLPSSEGRDARVIALNQFGQGGALHPRWIPALDYRARGMFFRRGELREARAQESRLPVLSARGDLLLLHAIFHSPRLGAVVGRSIATDDRLEDGIVGRKMELVLQLGDLLAELHEKGSADGFEVGLCLAGGPVGALI